MAMHMTRILSKAYHKPCTSCRRTTLVSENKPPSVVSVRTALIGTLNLPTLTCEHFSFIHYVLVCRIYCDYLMCGAPTSSSNPSLNVARTRTECGKRAFRVDEPIIYNNLPADVSSSYLVLTFKKRLETILFVRAFAD